MVIASAARLIEGPAHDCGPDPEVAAHQGVRPSFL
jgi:hypothetical protein